MNKTIIILICFTGTPMHCIPVWHWKKMLWKKGGAQLKEQYPVLKQAHHWFQVCFALPVHIWFTDCFRGGNVWNREPTTAYRHTNQWKARPVHGTTNILTTTYYKHRTKHDFKKYEYFCCNLLNWIVSFKMYLLFGTKTKYCQKGVTNQNTFAFCAHVWYASCNLF